MRQLAVCGECLRVGVFASYREAEQAPCDCGAVVPEGDVGPFCPCEACEQMAADLLAGGRDWKEVPMLKEGVTLKGWTPHQGELR
ncbi:hypothetical protein Q5W_09630 [Hydrogenophaga sp. PBC]|uniref:hypothetical protein n=1 Tax=Hydrogenophaga sp. PBC TaxID=795665 RepID=UPI0002607749|nr:hypothetical protein [Hydrogenophaga sp. PBC]AOS79205.1 hypothetical protein Q5W_09630 [Hydrogenophaga sp. PBC]